MTNKELHDLIKLIDKSNVAEFKYKKGDISLSIRSNDYFKNTQKTVVAAAPVTATPIAAASHTPAPTQPASPTSSTPAKSSESADENQDDDSKYQVFKSPMVGTFYRKPSPDKDVFVKVGDSIKKGDVVAIIEAMKLFNEIESEMEGKVVKVLVDDQTPVEYDQPLFLIDPA